MGFPEEFVSIHTGQKGQRLAKEAVLVRKN